MIIHEVCLIIIPFHNFMFLCRLVKEIMQELRRDLRIQTLAMKVPYKASEA